MKCDGRSIVHRRIVSSGLSFAIPQPGESLKKQSLTSQKPTREKNRTDPKLIAAARELRDRYLEQVNEEPGEAMSGKYDVSRAIDGSAGTRQLAADAVQSSVRHALPHAA